MPYEVRVDERTVRRRESCNMTSSGPLVTSMLIIPTLHRGQLGYYWCETIASTDGGKENTLPSSESPISSKIGFVTEPCQQPVPTCTSDVELYEEAVANRCASGIEPTDNFPTICPPTEVHTPWSTSIHSHTSFLPLKTSVIIVTSASVPSNTNLNTNNEVTLDVSDSTITGFIYILAGLALFVVLVIIISLICKCLRQRRKRRKGKSMT